MSASTENQTLSPLLDTIDILNETNITNKEAFVVRTDGMLLSYSFLVLAALLCVYFGSFRSIIHKDKQKKSGEKPDVLTAKDAAMFPFIASGFLFALFFCVLIGVWYLLKRHWISNNIFGIAFSINAIEILHFNKVINGCILLGGLFIYDIFWVFWYKW
ncbi:unnamed protein product [Rotaria sp. Silwood1]|nr:unnamed protein product [Rotaria sp. Silwood1]